MKLLCATDFSDSSRTAGRAAARLTARLGGKLHLVHVAHLPGTHLGTSATPFTVSKEEMARREHMLVEQADELRKLGASVTTTLLEGLPDERLLEHGEELAADAFAIGPRGDRREADWSLGSVAMHVIKGAHVPVFVFREEQSLTQWASGSRALRVMVGTDPGKPEQAAIGWLGEWMQAGPVELVCGYVYQPGEERSRSGSAQREASLAAAIVERTARWPELGTPRVRILAGFGRASEHILDLAASENADLVVVGTHRRSLVGRWLHGSVSLDLVASAKRNVVTVPLVAPAPKQREPGAIRRVLVPTDLSDLSARAIHWANTILPAGGTLQLLHVIAPYIPA